MPEITCHAHCVCVTVLGVSSLAPDRTDREREPPVLKLVEPRFSGPYGLHSLRGDLSRRLTRTPASFHLTSVSAPSRPCPTGPIVLFRPRNALNTERGAHVATLGHARPRGLARANPRVEPRPRIFEADVRLGDGGAVHFLQPGRPPRPRGRFLNKTLFRKTALTIEACAKLAPWGRFLHKILFREGVS